MSRVVYELDGVPLTVLGGEGILLDEPQTRARYEQASVDSLDASLLGPVSVDSPAQGAPFTSPLRVTGTVTEPVTLALTDWDGRILAEAEIDAAFAARTGFDFELQFEPGLYPRGALLASTGDTVVEIPLGR